MIYIEINEHNVVTMRHNLPMHAKHGLGKSEAELKQTGFLVDSIPDPDATKGIPVLKYDPTQNVFSYSYQTPAPSQEQRLTDIENALLNLMGI